MAKQNDSLSSSTSHKSASEINQRMALACQRADHYLSKNGFTTTQRHGQRISVTKNYPSTDAPWTEVFIGKIPRDMFEDEILPVLQRAGRICKIRLMMDFSGTTRGFGYVKYITPQEAAVACNSYHEVVLRQGCPPSIVLLSFDNKRLYFGNLPIDATKERIHKELSLVLDGVVDVELPEVSPSNKFRHANVTFKTHEAATQARRLLVPGVVKMFDRVIKVDWAIPVHARPKQKTNTLQPAGYSISQNPDSILGDRAKQMLARTDSESTVDDGGRKDWAEICRREWEDNSRRDWQHNSQKDCEDPPKSILVSNINPIHSTRLRRIFELNGRLKVTRIHSQGFSSFIITFETPDQASLMLEALLLMPGCFDKIAIPNQVLLAQYCI